MNETEYSLERLGSGVYQVQRITRNTETGDCLYHYLVKIKKSRSHGVWCEIQKTRFNTRYEALMALKKVIERDYATTVIGREVLTKQDILACHT